MSQWKLVRRKCVENSDLGRGWWKKTNTPHALLSQCCEMKRNMETFCDPAWTLDPTTVQVCLNLHGQAQGPSHCRCWNQSWYSCRRGLPVARCSRTSSQMSFHKLQNIHYNDTLKCHQQGCWTSRAKEVLIQGERKGTVSCTSPVCG